MADFIDDEASEVSSSNEELESDEEDNQRVRNRKSKSKPAKPKKKSREIIDSSEEEEEDDDEANEEMKDLINDEEEEEDEASSSDDDDRGDKRSHDDDDGSSSLDDDDIDLIRENTGHKIDKRKKFKRIRAPSDDDSEEEVDEARKIQNELFGSSALLESDDEDVQKQQSRPGNRDLDLDLDEDEDSDSEDNFIVDDNDQPIYKKTKKKGIKYSDSAMQQAQEIFGVDFDYDDVQDQDYDDGEGYDDDYEEEDETGELRCRKKKSGKKTIFEVYEPSELERSHMTAIDQKIRTKDEPERFQLRPVPITDANEEELDQETAWIYKTAFGMRTISEQEQDRAPIAGKLSEVLQPDIKYALDCIRNKKFEVSYIAAYCRDYVPSICSAFDDTKNLWTIYNYDAQWCKLQSGKNSIRKLYAEMKDYIATRPLDSRVRKIQDYDFERVNEISDFHELEDCRLHFKLHYSFLAGEQLEKKIEEVRSQRKAAAPEKPREKLADDEENLDDEEKDEDDHQDEGKGSDEIDNEINEDEILRKRVSKLKIFSSRDMYQKCREDSIGELVEKFGLTPEQFGENLREDYQRNNVGRHYTRPVDEAQKLLRPGIRFHSRESILKAATYMFTRQISADPLVRQTIRKFYFENAVIHAKPTVNGMKQIDENHPCYAFRFLRNKPVKELSGPQFLHLVNAERDKLLEMKFFIELIDVSMDAPRTMSPYYESLKALYYSEFSSHVTKEWNDQREEAVKTALDKYLMPAFEKQLREKLIKEAQTKIIKSCGEKLHDWLNVAPYAPNAEFDDHPDEDYHRRKGIRICGFTFAPDGDAPCFAAVIDQEGELIDHARLPYLNIRKRVDKMNSFERENHAKDRIKFKQFILNRKPHLIALSAETIQTKYICEDIAQIMEELHNHDGLPVTPIQIVDNELSSVYMNLKRANEEFPEFPALLLQAISNARRLNDPLSEYAKLCGHDDDILCIRFHHLQDELPKEEFLTSLQQKFVTRTNAVGVDPNRAIAHPHSSDLVQFIAGLGPRKAAHLLRLIKKSSTSGQLVSRQQLITELGMTPIVFVNCAGFIKLDTESLADDFPDEHVSPLDSTRIHPESYKLAKKIASDALDLDEDAAEDPNSNPIEEILDCPERLDELDLKAFAVELEKVQNQGKKLFTLESIRAELHCRYKDYRSEYKEPSQETIFHMLTKESEFSFTKGKLITCQVVAIPRKRPGEMQLNMANPVRIDETNLWRCPFCMRGDFQDLSVVWNHFDTNECPGYAIGVRCRLDNGLTGFIPTKFLSDKDIVDPAERVSIGQTIHARVMQINPEKFNCDLTCRTSDLIDEEGRWKPAKDNCYDETTERTMKRDLDAKSKRAARKPYCKRVIVHPAFENIDFKACEKKLENVEQGTAIIRPSSAGQNYLTVSWKVTENINQHVNIREEGKDNAFSLGHQLYIENEPYEDLDEIIARYVQPMARCAKEILKYKYCLKLPKGADEIAFMEDILHKEKAKSSTLAYRFLPSSKLPGKFLLGFMPKNKPLIEYLTVTPGGFRFRKLYFKNLVSLIKWFKENWNKNLPQAQYNHPIGHPMVPV